MAIHFACLEHDLQIIKLQKTREKLSKDVMFFLKQIFYRTEPQKFLSFAATPHEYSIILDSQSAEELQRESEVVLSSGDCWKALEIRGSYSDTTQQLALIQRVSYVLAKAGVSVLQLSTYQTDYVLVRRQDLEDAVQALDGMNSEAGEFDPEGRKTLPPHEHLLSIPDARLYLFSLDKQSLPYHMHQLVDLLFQPSGANIEFVSYTETEEEVSIMTSHEPFLQYAKQGHFGLIVSPDVWHIVQIGDHNLGFAETGIVASQSCALASTGTQVFYISTYSIDFIMIKDDEWESALCIIEDKFRIIKGCFAPLVEVENLIRDQE